MKNIFKNINRLIVFILIISFSYTLISVPKSFALEIMAVDNTQTKGGNPSSYQFIELLNNTDETIDISNYRIIDSGAPSSGHSITTTNLANDFTIPAKTKFIVSADPKKDIFQNIDCKVFKSSLGIGSVDNISIKNDDDIITTFPVSSVNTLDTTSCGNKNNDDTNNSTTSTSTKDKDDPKDSGETKEVIKYIYVPINNQDKYGDIQVLIPETKVVMALADNEYKVSAIDSNRQKINDLIYHFSFGDGGEAKGQSAIYHYTYPGEYYLVASAEGFSGGAKAIMKVTVVPPEIRIVKVIGENNENYIGLSNYAKYDLYLSNFILNVNGKDYKLPEDLLLAKGKTTYLSGEAIGFILKDKKVSLFYPNHQLLDKYEINDEVSDSSTTNLLDTENIATTTILENKNLVKVIENSVKQSIVQTKSKLKAEIKDDNFKTIENIKEKEGEDENIAVITNNQEDILTLNRLILDIDNKIISLDKEENSKSRNKDKKIVKNNDKVDIGIINWFKNLLY